MNTPDITNDLTYVVSWQNSPECCKIGKTTHISNRFRAFLNAHHAPLNILMVCDSSVASEQLLHSQFASNRITLEHFELTDDLKAMIETINFSTGFKPYTVERPPFNSKESKDERELQSAIENIMIEPLKLSPREYDALLHQACGLTLKESANLMKLPEQSVKSHRSAAVSKCFTPNAFAAISKMFFHGKFDKKLLTNLVNQ